MTSTSFRRMLRHTPMRDLVRGRVTGRLDIERMLEASSLSEAAASKVRNVVKRTRLWRLEKVDVAHELIAHFLDGIETGMPIDELIETFGDEKQTAKLIRRAKKRQRPMPWHVFAWARLCLLTFFGVYVLAALYLMTGSPSVTTDYLTQLNKKAAAVPAEEAAWPLYREALLELDLDEEREWETPIPYYSNLPAQKLEEMEEQAKQNYEMFGGGYGSGELYPESQSYLDPPYEHTRWERLEKSLRPGTPGWGATVAYLNEHQGTIELIRRGAAKSGLGFEVGFTCDYSEVDRRVMNIHADPALLASEAGKTYRDLDRALIGVFLPHLQPMRRLAQLLSADALRSAEAGDGLTALEDINAVLNLSEQCDEHPFLINGLVGLSIRVMSFRAVQTVLIKHPGLWSDEQLTELTHRLASVEVSHEAWLNSERLWFYDYLQRTYTDDGNGGGQITKQGVQNFESYGSGSDPFGGPHMPYTNAMIVAGLPAASVLVAPRGEMRRIYDELMDQAILEGYKPLWEYDQEALMESRVERMAETHITRLRYLPIIIFMPALSSVTKTIHNEAGLREGVLIGITLELYRREHGDWPDALSALSPTYLPSIPVDRLTGAPVKYRVKDAGPVVYSVGVDGDDDGGRPPVERDGDIVNEMASPKQYSGESMAEEAYDGDWVLWPVPEEQE